jgi:sec-independent protein translocase protein TatC
VFYQLWAFIAAGLYPHEKKYVHRYLPMSLGLFIAGVLLCQFMVIPNAIRALLWFNEWLELEPDLRLNEWLGFAILLPLVFGLSFQTPLIMLFLGKVGIMDADSFRRKRRIAWFVIAIFAAIVTPSDPWSMILLMIPMWGLYELGILMVAYSAPPPEPAEEEQPDELVGV